MKIFLVLVVLVAVVVFVIRLQSNEYRNFMKTAVEVKAIVTGREERVVEPKTRRTQYVIRYSFEVAGKAYSGEESVEYADLWSAVQTGNEISVYYAPENPAKNYPAALINRRLGIASAMGQN